MPHGLRECREHVDIKALLINTIRFSWEVSSVFRVQDWGAQGSAAVCLLLFAHWPFNILPFELQCSKLQEKKKKNCKHCWADLYGLQGIHRHFMPKESQLSQRDTEDNVSFSIFFFTSLFTWRQWTKPRGKEQPIKRTLTMNVSLDPFTEYKYVGIEGSIFTEQTLYCHMMNITSKMNIICHLAWGQMRIPFILLLYVVYSSYKAAKSNRSTKQMLHTLRNWVVLTL